MKFSRDYTRSERRVGDLLSRIGNKLERKLGKQVDGGLYRINLRLEAWQRRVGVKKRNALLFSLFALLLGYGGYTLLQALLLMM